MATMGVALKNSIKLLSPSIIVLILLWVIAVNSRVGIARSGVPNEVDYYEGISGVHLESKFPWPDFKNLDGFFLRVSRQGLRQESLKVLDALGACRVFVDTSQGVIWMTGFSRVQMDEPMMFVYYWISPSGGDPPASDDSPLIGIV